MFSDGLLAQKARLFKKLLAFASFSNCVGILPIKWLEERLSKVRFRRPSWRGIWPESWFSDKSNSVRHAKLPNFSGIGLEILFWRRFRVFNVFHDIISGGREPESRFWSRKRVVKWGRDVNSRGIVPVKRLLLTSNTTKFLQEDTPAGIILEK